MQNAYSPPCDCRICPCCFPGKQKNWTTTTTLKQRLKVWSPALVSLHQAAMVRTNRLVSIILIFLFWTSKHQSVFYRHPDPVLRNISGEFLCQIKTGKNKQQSEILIFSWFIPTWSDRLVFFFLMDLTAQKGLLKHPQHDTYDLLLWSLKASIPPKLLYHGSKLSDQEKKSRGRFMWEMNFPKKISQKRDIFFISMTFLFWTTFFFWILSCCLNITSRI